MRRSTQKQVATIFDTHLFGINCRWFMRSVELNACGLPADGDDFPEVLWCEPS
jgi:hypothetical protein